MPDHQVSKPGAKPQPPSLPRQTPETTHARITLRGDRVRLRKTCPYYGVSEAYQTDHFERSRYAKEADILGTFYDIYGTSDTGPVKLSGLGWDEMMQNVVKLEVVYDEGDEEQPGKQG